MSTAHTPRASKHLKTLGLNIALEGETNGEVSKEIEHTYYAKLTSLDQLANAASKEEHEQWEMRKPVGEAKYAGSVRVRKTVKDGQTSYVLCSKTFVKGDAGKDEVEIEITDDMFEQVKRLADSGMIKTRHFFPVEGSERVWEIDAYPLKDGEGFSPWVKVDFEMDSAAEKVPTFPLETEVLYDSPFNKRTPEESAMIGKLMKEVFTRENPNPVDAEIAQEGIGIFLNRLLGRKGKAPESATNTRADRDDNVLIDEVEDTYCNPAWLRKQTFKTGTINAPMVSRYLQINGDLLPERVGPAVKAHVGSVVMSVNRYRVACNAYNRLAIDKLKKLYALREQDPDLDGAFKGLLETHPAHHFAFDKRAILGELERHEYGHWQLKPNSQPVEVPALTAMQAARLAPLVSWALRHANALEDASVDRPGDVVWEMANGEALMEWIYSLSDHAEPAGEVFSIKHNDEFYMDPIISSEQIAGLVASALVQWIARSVEAPLAVAQEGIISGIRNWMQTRAEKSQNAQAHAVKTFQEAETILKGHRVRLTKAREQLRKSKLEVSGEVVLDSLITHFSDFSVGGRAKPPANLLDSITKGLRDFQVFSKQVMDGYTTHALKVIDIYQHASLRSDQEFRFTFLGRADDEHKLFFTKLLPPGKTTHYMGGLVIGFDAAFSEVDKLKGDKWWRGYVTHRGPGLIYVGHTHEVIKGQSRTFTKAEVERLMDLAEIALDFAQSMNGDMASRRLSMDVEGYQYDAFLFESGDRNARYRPNLNETYRDMIDLIQVPGMTSRFYHRLYQYTASEADNYARWMVQLVMRAVRDF